MRLFIRKYGFLSVINEKPNADGGARVESYCISMQSIILLATAFRKNEYLSIDPVDPVDYVQY